MPGWQTCDSFNVVKGELMSFNQCALCHAYSDDIYTSTKNLNLEVTWIIKCDLCGNTAYSKDDKVYDVWNNRQKELKELIDKKELSQLFRDSYDYGRMYGLSIAGDYIKPLKKKFEELKNNDVPFPYSVLSMMQKLFIEMKDWI